jgi:hypothetical protein
MAVGQPAFENGVQASEQKDARVPMHEVDPGHSRSLEHALRHVGCPFSRSQTSWGAHAPLVHGSNNPPCDGRAAHAPEGSNRHVALQVNGRVWSPGQPVDRCVVAPGAHSPEFAHAPTIVHSQRSLQRRDCVPQLPQLVVSVLPGTQPPSFEQGPYSHSPALEQKRVRVPQLPQRTDSVDPGREHGSTLHPDAGS